MTTLMQFLTSPPAHALLHALGWTLLHFCWQGTIVAAVLWSLLQLLATRSSQSRYAAACLAMALLVALPLITFAHLASTSLKATHTAWNDATPIDPALLLQITVAATPAPWPARITVALDRFMPWLLALWLAGALFFVARLNFGLLVAHRLKSTATEAPSTELLQLFDDLKRRLGIDGAVRLLDSARVQVPTVIGWLRPVILIPARCLTGLSTEQIEAIFCHELAHVRRHDYLVSVFQSIAEALLFYHPAVWWISKQVRRERECCCDAIAVANGGDVLAYAKALSFLEERRAAFPEFVLGANGGVLTMRIKRLLGRNDSAPASQFAALALLALMLAVAGSYVATMARAESKAAPHAAASLTPPMHAIPLAQAQPARDANPQPLAAPNPEQPVHGVYKSWLNEDVVYIITPEERVAFLNLTNDEERDKFIENFWARRDPPGSAPNTFRQEHYARIAYSNQHFASNTTVGWKSDRGRIYIVYGKPAEIDSHPGGGGAAYPYEVWSYPYIAGIGDSVKLKFVDTCQCGDYHYTIDDFSNGQGTPDTSQRLSSSAKLFAPPYTYRPPPPTGPVRVSPGIMSGAAIHKINPIYPPDAKAAHIQGSVVLNAIIGKDGSVENLQVISGPPALAGSAIDAVKQWKYDPYLLNGQPVEIETTITVNFTLPDSPNPQGQGTTTQPDATVSEYNGVPLKKIGNGVSAPMVIYQVEPQFSQEASQAKFMGVVLLNLIVDQDGLPQNVHVVRGVGMGLDEKAVEAVRQYKFKPAMENGSPVPVSINVEVNFQIFDKPPTSPAVAEAAKSFPGVSGTFTVPPTTKPDLATRKIGGGVSTPIVIYSVSPEYTPEARKAKTEGIVLVNLIVDQHGVPQNVHVVHGIDVGLDENAVEAVRQYRFRPAMEDGKPVRVELDVEVNFKLF
jgi:TonB family protein